MKNRIFIIFLVLLSLTSLILSSISLARSSYLTDILKNTGNGNYEMTMMYQEGGQVVVGTEGSHAQFISNSFVLTSDSAFFSSVVHFEKPIFSNGLIGVSDKIACGEKTLSFSNGIFVGVD